MSYEIRERGGKFYVVDTSNNDKIRGTYDNEDAAEDRKDELDFRATVRDRIRRMPVTEMTAEEKAKEYDRLMAEKNSQPPTDPNRPPKKEPPTEQTKPKRSAYWGDALNED